MEIKDVVTYAMLRFNYYSIDYEVYNAKTGSTYIRVGKDRIRISDHPGEYDDYNFIIRTDCINPVPIKGKIAVSSKNADIVLDILIRRNKEKKGYHKPEKNEYRLYRLLKNLDIALLYKIVRYDKSLEPPLSKNECINRIVENISLITEYIQYIERSDK